MSRFINSEQMNEMIYMLMRLRPQCAVISGLAFALEVEAVNDCTMTEVAKQIGCTRAAISKNCRNFIECMDLNDEIRDPRYNQDDKVLRTWKGIGSYFNVSGNTIKRWYQTKNLPVYKIGGVWCAKQSALNKWANEYRK